MTNPIATLTGGLIVSCQAYPGEPLRHPETMAQMAEAVVAGGAVAIRAQGLADISFIKGRTTVPLIGLWKDGHDGVFITPTLRHARLARVFTQLRLVVEGVHVRRTSLHAQEDHALRLRGKMRCLWRERSRAFCGGSARGESLESEPAKPGGDGLEQVAPREHRWRHTAAFKRKVRVHLR